MTYDIPPTMTADQCSAYLLDERVNRLCAEVEAAEARICGLWRCPGCDAVTGA